MLDTNSLRVINCTANSTYTAEGTFTRVNIEYFTKNGEDYEKNVKVTILPKHLKRYPAHYARKHGAWHLVNISEEDKAYLLSLPVNDAMRVQQLSNEATKAKDTVGATEAVVEKPKRRRRKKTETTPDTTDTTE